MLLLSCSVLIQRRRAAAGHLLDPNNEAQGQAATENLATGGNSAVCQTPAQTQLASCQAEGKQHPHDSKRRSPSDADQFPVDLQ